MSFGISWGQSYQTKCSYKSLNYSMMPTTLGKKATLQKIGNRYFRPGRVISVNGWRLVDIFPSFRSFDPVSDSKYLLIMIDRETRWLEVVLLCHITVEMVANALYSNWIRYSVPLHVTSDRATQFQSILFSELCQLNINHNIQLESQWYDGKNTLSTKGGF